MADKSTPGTTQPAPPAPTTPNGKLKSFNAKAMIAQHVEAKTVVRYADRLKCEIITETEFYKIGQIITPHKIMAEALIKQGIAKEVK